jgi:hypothetical protein
MFIALGRVFDQNPRSPYTLDKLVGIARDNPGLFSRDRLAERKRRGRPKADEWLPAYLENAYAPVPEDFRRLSRRFIGPYRRKYERACQPIRNKIYAHKEAVRVDAQDLFAGTSVAELQRIIDFLQRLHLGLHDLYHNGRVRPGRRPPLTVESITRRLDDGSRGGTAQVIIVEAVRRVVADMQGSPAPGASAPE